MTKDNMTTALAVLPSMLVPTSGSIEAYIAFVNSIPLLSPEEEFNLAEEWRTSENVEAARFLVMSHLRLVVSIARGYAGYGLPLADLIQEGTIGLMKAVKRFDARKNVRLVTFAIHWIRSEINEYVIKNWRIVRTVTTKNQRKLFFNLRSLRESVGNMSEEEANRIATDLNVSRDEIVDMNMRLTGSDVSLLSDSDDEFAPGDWLSDEQNMPEKILEKRSLDLLQTEGVKNAIEALDERSRDIILSRWLADTSDQKTLHDLAEKYGVSAERVRQIEVRALQKMKEYLSESYHE